MWEWWCHVGSNRVQSAGGVAVKDGEKGSTEVILQPIPLIR